VRMRTVPRGAFEVVRAVGAMTLIEFWLRTRDLPSTCRRLGIRLHLDEPDAAVERAVLPRWSRPAVLVALAVTRVWPAGDTCLRRCLVIGHRLRRLEPILRIGVRRDDDGRFAAHSWLEFDGRTLDPTASAFVPLGLTGASS
jgi:hypothetical protein